RAGSPSARPAYATLTGRMIHWRPFTCGEACMGRPRRTLKLLRTIALEHASVAHPDLASMARELGQLVHRDSAAIAARLARLPRRGQGLGRWLLAQRNQPPVSVLVMAWP